MRRYTEIDTNNKPHSREEYTASGTAHGTYKTDKVGSGSVGSGGRKDSKPSSSGGNRAGERGSGSSLLLIGALVALFAKMSPKTRKVVLTIVAVIAVIALLKSFMGGFGGTTVDPEPDPTPTPSNPIVNPEPDPEPDPGPVTPVVENTSRARYYTPKGNGKDEVTIMVYMCGTDLESNYGMATADLVEMTNANITDQVNIIVETGGCKKWRNNIVSSTSNEVYQVVAGGVNKLGQSNAVSMVKPSTLTTFVKYCAENFPADRYILIFWDHGGGSITGYGYDEKMGGSDSMTLDEINSALGAAGVKFDWIGFDACLMATYETATVTNNYADYLIASEESEPGTGWYYTNWLNKLCANTSIDTVSLGKVICDDFVSTSVKADSRAQVTLSLIDLAEMQATVPSAFNAFSIGTENLITGSSYSVVSNARSGVRQFAASSRLNQVDLLDLADRINTKEAKAFATAMRSCIKYNKTNISKAYGVSIYFPYESMSSVSSATSILNAISFDSSYTKCIKSFASLVSGGQYASSSGGYGYNYGSGSGIDLSSLFGGLTGSNGGYGSSYDTGYSSGSYGSLLGSLLGNYANSSGQTSSGSSISASDILGLLSGMSGRSITSGETWVDTDLIAGKAQYVSENYLDPGAIFVQKSGNHRFLTLTDAQWALVQTMELNIFVDDGKGYIDLGLDNLFTIDGNDLSLDWDGTWLTVNGQTAPYYLVSDTEEADGSWTTVGRIPALLTNKNEDGETVTNYVDLTVVFDKANPKGVITGATVCYVDGTRTAAKGGMSIEPGDTIQFLCDYYTYDGEYEATYKFGEPFTVPASGLTLANMKLEDGLTCSVTYRLTDIYNNYFWTPAWIAD